MEGAYIPSWSEGITVFFVFSRYWSCLTISKGIDKDSLTWLLLLTACFCWGESADIQWQNIFTDISVRTYTPPHTHAISSMTILSMVSDFYFFHTEFGRHITSFKIKGIASIFWLFFFRPFMSVILFMYKFRCFARSSVDLSVKGKLKS